jgi:signal transduction histidine kinase
VRPQPGPAVTYVVPAGAEGPWDAASVPPDWQRREMSPDAHLKAALIYPRVSGRAEEVMAAVEHQLAISLHGAYLWQRTLAQDEQRRVLVGRLLNATEDERRRLARELHDEIAQLLTAIQLALEHVEVESAEMKRARALLVEAQKEMHRIIYDLRPSLLDDLGLAAAIQAHARDHLERRGLTVSLEVEDGLPARAAIDTTIFRVYQELATNILRHAEAEHVSVEVYERDGRRVLEVEDDGRGFDPDEKFGGAGITGMRERVALVNGTIRVDSEPGLGTHAIVEIPLT